MVKNNAENVSVFSCLAQKQGEKGYQQYFVSEDYNVSAASSKVSYARPIAGRFIFVPNEEKKLVVHALAQESTKSLARSRNTSIEYVYLEKKLTHSTGNMRFSSLQNFCISRPNELL